MHQRCLCGRVRPNNKDKALMIFMRLRSLSVPSAFPKLSCVHCPLESGTASIITTRMILRDFGVWCSETCEGDVRCWYGSSEHESLQSTRDAVEFVSVASTKAVNHCRAPPHWAASIDFHTLIVRVVRAQRQGGIETMVERKANERPIITVEAQSIDHI